MSFIKFKSNSCCLGGRYRTATTKIYGITTSKASKVLNGFWSVCNRKNSMTVSDNSIQVEALGRFFGILGNKFG